MNIKRKKKRRLKTKNWNWKKKESKRKWFLPIGFVEPKKDSFDLSSNYTKIIDNLVDIAKGRKYDYTFYRLLHIKDRLYNIKKNTYEIQWKLQDAWWVDEDDIRQALYLASWKINLTSRGAPIWHHFLLIHHLRDFIYEQRVFNIQIDQEEYKHYYEQVLTDKDPCFDTSLSCVFSDNNETILQHLNLSFFNKYLYYLAFICGLIDQQIADFFMVSKRTAEEMMKKLRKEMEKCYGESNIPSRYSSTIFEKRGGGRRLRR